MYVGFFCYLCTAARASAPRLWVSFVGLFGRSLLLDIGLF